MNTTTTSLRQKDAARLSPPSSSSSWQAVGLETTRAPGIEPGGGAVKLQRVIYTHRDRSDLRLYVRKRSTARWRVELRHNHGTEYGGAVELGGNNDAAAVIAALEPVLAKLVEVVDG